MEELQMRERQREIQQWRREHHPREFPNCGSVFKNPPGDFAARLIEEAGLKGTRSGGAQVSEKHANFIVNRGDAKAADVLGLIDLIRETVYHRTRIELEMEIQILPSQMADMADPG
jgi:UDP-N-acetylmuramate dehydrogenase